MYRKMGRPCQLCASSDHKLSDTTRRGTLSKNRKYCLSRAKIKAEGRPRGLDRFSDSPKACAEASDERPKPSAPPRPSRRGPLAEAPPRNALDGIPILRFARGWARQTTSSPPSRPTPLTKRHVQLMRPTAPATSVAHRHSSGRTTDATGDRAQQGLPATMLITVPPADTRTALCYLTPAPRTKRHGGSSPGPCSLGISMKDQLFFLRLARDPPARPRTYYSFSASAEAGLVPHPRRLRLYRPSSEPSHPFKCA